MSKGNALQAAKARIVTLEKEAESTRTQYGAALNRVEQRVLDLISTKQELADSLEEVQASRLDIQKSAAEQFKKDAVTIRRYQWLVGLAVVTFILQGINYVIG